ncbi:sugar dehydrogenase complex small subunit [Thioclava sp. F28-4]|uniref:sugar dehydrogenase complex small subunit n=1 Tax=Thioclava sp. F28-4 TaxID=1915315 RepID=UPI000996D7D1|nr:sugar dehydrogenase complex small subunit [Thioclava sp. F28-4]OOY06648.1 hypothetical protein BMI87_03965 [Thioclava sp. F28-4]
MSLDRRRFLIALAGTVPLASLTPGFARAADSTAPSDAFLSVSRAICGNDSLSKETAARIEKLLSKDDAGFASKLDGLAKAFDGKDRAAAIDGLSDEQTTLALSIAKPWYLGFTGSPSARILKDDAEFATFLEAQALTKVSDIVPLQTYPSGGAGWWQEVPKGVDASDLPEEATSWEYQPKSSYELQDPDAAWLAYAKGEVDSVDAARKAQGADSGGGSGAKAGASGSPNPASNSDSQQEAQ